MASLSGGNQQKVVVSRWFARPVRLLVLIDPTRGVDVRAKAEIHRFIGELAGGGVAVLVVSSDLPEIIDHRGPRRGGPPGEPYRRIRRAHDGRGSGIDSGGRRDVSVTATDDVRQAWPRPTGMALASAPGGRERLRRLTRIQELGLVVVLVALVAYFSAFAPGFDSSENIKTIFIYLSVLGVLSIGQTLVILAGGFDLSNGAVLAFASSIGATMLASGGNPVVAVVATLAVAVGIGLVNGVLMAILRVNAFIATLGTFLIFSGAAYVYTNSQTINFPLNEWVVFGRGTLAFLPTPVLILLVLSVIAVLVLRYTVYGRSLYAIGGNPQAARLSGIPVKRYLVIVFVISGLSAGVGALIQASLGSAGSATYTGELNLQSITAVILGGAALTGGGGQYRRDSVGRRYHPNNPGRPDVDERVGVLPRRRDRDRPSSGRPACECSPGAFRPETAPARLGASQACEKRRWRSPCERARMTPEMSRLSRQVTNSTVTSKVAFWSDGSQVTAVLSRPKGGDVYPAVIWSHGYGGYSDAIGAAVVAEHLQGRDMALLRLDHRGCGRSQPSVKGPCVQGSESVHDLVNAVTYLRARRDIDHDHVVLMGESHGGAAALCGRRVGLPCVRGAGYRCL